MTTYEVRNKKILIATLMFNKMLEDNIIEKFLVQRGQELDTRFTNVTLKEIHKYVREFKDTFNVEIRLWRPKMWRFSPALAMTNHPSKMYLNKYKLDRSVESIVGSIAHEWGHCFEKIVREKVNKGIIFNHGDNSRVGKENTFQYWLGVMARKEAVNMKGCMMSLNTSRTAYDIQFETVDNGY